MREMIRGVWGIRAAGLAVCVLALLSIAHAAGQQAEGEAGVPAIDAEAYKEFVADGLWNATELNLWFKGQQSELLSIVPPGEDVVLRQPSGEVLPYDPKTFPPEFGKNLVLNDLNGVPAYRLTIAEDARTRETLFLNEKNQLVFALPPEPDYDPRWYLEERWPALFTGRYTPGYVDFMSRLYDPARVQVEVTLIPSEYVEPYLYIQERLAQEAAEQALSSGGGSMLMSYQGPPVTNICFTAVERRTNGLRVTVAYPYTGATYPTNCFTNRLDVFYSADILESWWELAATTNVSPATNWIEWTDRAVTSTWASVRFFASGNADLDSDGDGYPDAREILMYHSNPNDANSHPVSVSGSVGYGGPEAGTIYALATVVSNGWSPGCAAEIPGPGSYTNSEVALFRSYWFKAFRDVDGSHAWDSWEPWGLCSPSSTYVTSNLSGLDITLQDVPSIWGTISYTGTATGNVYVVAVTASNSFDTTYQQLIPWIQGESSTTGGETYLTFPVNYSIVGLPHSNYWIRAFMDEDYNGQHTFFEVAGQYSSNAIPVGNRVTGANITMAFDADGDGMADGWELMYGHPPDTGGDGDGDELSNLQESLFGTNPFGRDTDQDGLADAEEVTAGLDPLYSPLQHRLTSLSFTYDDQDRLKRVESPPASVELGYDDAGNLSDTACSRGN